MRHLPQELFFQKISNLFFWNNKFLYFHQNVTNYFKDILSLYLTERWNRFIMHSFQYKYKCGMWSIKRASNFKNCEVFEFVMWHIKPSLTSPDDKPAIQLCFLMLAYNLRIHISSTVTWTIHATELYWLTYVSFMLQKVCM